jgi:V/A-type H+/Na+-transporting ATPase subunit F
VRKIVVIATPDARPGFALAGVRQLTSNADELPSMLRQLAGDPLTGVLIVDERLVTGLVQEQLRDMARRWPGLVIVLPAPQRAGRAEEEDYVLQLIRRAIGYQVRLNL